MAKKFPEQGIYIKATALLMEHLRAVTCAITQRGELWFDFEELANHKTDLIGNWRSLQENRNPLMISWHDLWGCTRYRAVLGNVALI